MAVSQNGWTVLSGYGDNRLVNIPKIIGKVRGGDVATLFTDLIEQFHATVESVDIGRDDWGFAPRPIRGGSTPSNHASGTAIDLNAQRHGLGKRGTFTGSQVAAIRRLLARYTDNDGRQVIRWGGDYSGRADEMHFEINASAARVKQAVSRLGSAQIKPAAPAAPSGPREGVPDSAHVRDTQSIRDICTWAGHGTKENSLGLLIERYQHRQHAPYQLVADRVWGARTEAHYQWTKDLQNAMNRWKGYSIGVDGDYREGTVARVLDIQKRNQHGTYKGYLLDGVAGPVFCKMLGIPAHP